MDNEEKVTLEIKPNLDKLKQEIRELSTKLRTFGEQKEKYYKEKNDLDKELNSSIKSAKELKEKKAEIDKEIKELKVKREKLNTEMKSMFAKLAELKKNLGFSKDNIKRENSGDVMKQIAGMQFAIQTEALSFDREKQYMERIKKLKLKLKELETEEAEHKELAEFRKNLHKTKTDADSVHSEIQNLAGTSSELFKELTANSTIIANIKRRRNDLQKMLRNLKTQIDSLNSRLGNLLVDWSEGTSKAVAISDRENISAMKQKTAEVMDKFKKKKRLTTEDILLLQRQALRE